MSVSRAFCPASSNHNRSCSTGVLKRLLHVFPSSSGCIWQRFSPSLKATRWCTHAQACTCLVLLCLPSFCATRFNNGRESQRDANSCLLTWCIHVGMFICLKKNKKNLLYIPSVALLVLGHYILSGNRKLGLGLIKLCGSENPQQSICSSMLVLQRLFESVHPC